MTALIGAGLLLAALFVWQPALLRQIIAPPLIDKGYHVSKLWLERRDRYWAAHPDARCCVTFRRSTRIVTVLGFERGMVLWRPVVMRTTVKALQLHEAIYPRNGAKRSDVSDFWLFPMTSEAHRKLHTFDRALWPTLTLGLWHDRRNRLLWLSTLLYVYGRYAIPLALIWGWWVMSR